MGLRKEKVQRLELRAASLNGTVRPSLCAHLQPLPFAFGGSGQRLRKVGGGRYRKDKSPIASAAARESTLRSVVQHRKEFARQLRQSSDRVLAAEAVPSIEYGERTANCR
jgi:hypothetical protein